MDDKLIETIARMWIECDPNRDNGSADEIMPLKFSSGGTDAPAQEYDNPMGGQPRWKWFVPRAEATLAFLREHGLAIVPVPR